MNKTAAYLIAKLTATAAVTILLVETDAEFIGTLISALVFSCFILADFIFSKLQKGKAMHILLLLCIAGGCFYTGAGVYFPLLAVGILELCDLLTESRYLFRISAICIVLLAVVFQVNTIELLITAIITVGLMMAAMLLKQNEKLDICLTETKEENAELAQKVNDMRTYVKTLRETAAMEERNRFAARIHDQLGHSISGSIILLEAAQLSLKGNPQKAEEIIGTATENLRSGVDEIRKSLREERPERDSLGLGEIKVKLEGFGLAYEMKTALTTEGNTELIPLPIWICINENLGEALTNTLKHSKATAFHVKISVLNKLIRVEYGDNGCCDMTREEEQISTPVRKGMGLETIEDRTVVSGGKCFFHKGEDGFIITNLFPIS